MTKRKRTSRTDPRLRKPESKRKARAFGAFIVARRDELGLSQVQVSKLCDWPPGRQWKYESGYALPRIAAARTLAKVLLLDPRVLFAICKYNGLADEGES